MPGVPGDKGTLQWSGVAIPPEAFPLGPGKGEGHPRAQSGAERLLGEGMTQEKEEFVRYTDWGEQSLSWKTTAQGRL